MSKVIKSSRVVEIQNYIKDDDNNTNKQSKENILLEAQEEYDKRLKEANIKSEDIISKANEKAELIIQNAYERANSIIEEHKQKGYEEGYNNGYQEGKKNSDVLITEANEIKSKYLQERSRVLNSIESDVINLVIEICEKILSKNLQDDEENILSIVLKGLDSLNNSDSITVIVSEDDFNIVEMSKDRLLSMGSLIENIKIKKDVKMEKGDCVIETTNGSVDVGLKTQLEELESVLINLLNSE